MKSKFNDFRIDQHQPHLLGGPRHQQTRQQEQRNRQQCKAVDPRHRALRHNDQGRGIGDQLSFLFIKLSAGHLMLAGFLLLLGGLVLRARGPGIWLVLAGVAVFLLGLAWNMHGPQREAPQRTGGFWRDRYIRYDEPRAGGVRSWFTRWRR